MSDSPDTLDIVIPEGMRGCVVCVVPDAFVRVARDRLSSTMESYVSGCSRGSVWRFSVRHAPDAVRLANGVFGTGYAYDIDRTRPIPHPLGVPLSSLPTEGIGESLSTRLDTLRVRAESHILPTRTEASRLAGDAIGTLRDMAWVEYALYRLVGRADSALAELDTASIEGVSGTASDAIGLYREPLMTRRIELIARRDQFTDRCEAFLAVVARLFPDGLPCSR